MEGCKRADGLQAGSQRLHKVGVAPCKQYEVGFQHEGRLRDARYINGEFIDIHYYAVLAHEWKS